MDSKINNTLQLFRFNKYLIRSYLFDINAVSDLIIQYFESAEEKKNAQV